MSTDTKGQDQKLQRADLEKLCLHRGWTVAKVYQVKESAFGGTPRVQFQAMLDGAQGGQFAVLVCWSLDRFSREGEWSVPQMISTLLSWRVHFVSYNEPFLNTADSPFAGALVGLFAFLARQDSVRKGRARQTGHGEGPLQWRGHRPSAGGRSG